MGRARTGSVRIRNGKMYARVTYRDIKGNIREIEHRVRDEIHAQEVIKQLLEETAKQEIRKVYQATMTFKDLADYFVKNYLKPPEYVQGQKVEGLRSYKNCLLYLKVATEHFGNKLLKFIKWNDILNYKVKRLKTPTHHNKERALATVNRELAYVRRAFEIAKQQGWIEKNPFTQGNGLISLASETKRERILSRDEEKRLLSVCVGRCAHLKPILICAIDSGMRMGEIYKLKWKDINWDMRLITIQAHNSKTLKERRVAMTSRLEKELWELWALDQIHKHDPNELVFGVQVSCKNAFDTVRHQAGLPDLRLHDLRHTCASRLIQVGVPLQQVGRLLGHTQPSTTYRYINIDASTATQAANALDTLNLQVENEEISHLKLLITKN